MPSLSSSIVALFCRSSIAFFLVEASALRYSSISFLSVEDTFMLPLVVVPNSCIRIIDQIQALQYRKRVLETNLFPGATPSSIQFKMYRLCDSLGIKRRSPHKGRKTYISTLLNDGFDADFVREQVGHKELQTTLNCYTYSTTRREEQVKKLQKSLAL